jgi:hypothetical protein
MGIATIVAIFGAIGANFWLNRFPPAGKTIANLANSTYGDVLFIPANYAFAIWGLIYCGLIGFSFYQLTLSKQPGAFALKARLWLILACLFQSCWVYAFLQQALVLSTLLMAALLLMIIRCYEVLEIGERQLAGLGRWLLHYPFSIYLGWISVATIVNVAITLKHQGWNAWGIFDPIWTVVMMGIATLLAVTVLQQRRDRLFVAVVIWALIALILRYQTLPLILWGGIALVLSLMGALLAQRYFSPAMPKP